MKIRLVVIAVFVSVSAVPGVLAARAGLFAQATAQQVGAVSATLPVTSGQFRVTTLDWPRKPAGLAAADGLVVWEQRGKGGRPNGIWGYDVGRQEAYRMLAPDEAGRVAGTPGVSRGMLVWPAGHGRDTLIRGYDRDTGGDFVVGRGLRPVAAGDTLVWVERAGRGVDARDTLAGTNRVSGERFTLATDGRARQAAVWGRWLAWTGGPGRGSGVWAANRLGTTRYKLADAGWSVALDSRRVVWATPAAGDGGLILSWDRRSRHSQVLWHARAKVDSLVLSRREIVWAQATGGGDIWRYDFASGRASPVCADPRPQSDPVLVGRTVFWADARNGGWELYGRQLEP